MCVFKEGRGMLTPHIQDRRVVFIPNKTYFANPTERITRSYLSVLLNALTKVVIAIQIVLVKIFLGSVL